MLDIIIKYAVWLILVIIIHELGHYIGFRLLGIKPKIKITLYGGIFMGTQLDIYKLKPAQLFLIAFYGVFAGLLFTMLTFDEMLMPYLFASLIDFNTMYGCWSYGLRSKKTIFQLEEKKLNEIRGNLNV